MRAIVFIIALLFALPAWTQTNGDPKDNPATNQTVADADVPAALTQSTFDKETIQVGDPIPMTLTVRHPIDTDVVLPDTFGTKRWTLVDQTSATRPHESGQETTLHLTFSVFRPGPSTLPSFDVAVLDRDGNTTPLPTQPIAVKVLDGLGDQQDPTFKAPRKPVEIWVEDFTLAWVGGFGLSAIVLGLLGFFFWNRREVIVIPPPPRAPHEIALEKLSAIAADDMMERGEFMLFYVKVSEAIREYMGNVHKFPGTELTTTEILAELEEKFFPRGISKDDIGDFLRETDLVKFSGVKPTTDASERVLRRAFTIVELTRMPTAGLSPVNQTSDGEESEKVDETTEIETSPWSPDAAEAEE